MNRKIKTSLFLINKIIRSLCREISEMWCRYMMMISKVLCMKSLFSWAGQYTVAIKLLTQTNTLPLRCPLFCCFDTLKNLNRLDNGSSWRAAFDILPLYFTHMYRDKILTHFRLGCHLFLFIFVIVQSGYCNTAHKYTKSVALKNLPDLADLLLALILDGL